jgi:mRNA interferase MazF
VSPDELNEHLSTCIVAPLTTGGRAYPFRIPCRFENKTGYVVTDQLRTVDRDRVVRNLGKMAAATMGKTLLVLQEMFRP